MAAVRQYLKDYAQPAFLIRETHLTFELNDGATLVTGTFEIERNPENQVKVEECVLVGEDLKLVSVYLNNKGLKQSDYRVTEAGLEIDGVPDQFQLTIKTQIYPEDNSCCEGLYQSNQLYCTQCEAHGFRKIIYYLDRPDVMSKFTTKIIANKAKYPVLLSNGNLIGQGEEGELHWTLWHDPFIKPSYLFALVAGDLACIEDVYITRQGRQVMCQFYVEHKNKEKCAHAMQALKNAMRWDEENYGLEYDLDRYMVVAVDDFNMGAMENKGLNIFNSKFVLANPETATDLDYQRVEDVIGHEYFHNWTGNRVTCRDWFQLSLKEGLTVFREQSFSADMTSSALKRIQDVRTLRSTQFPEDSSPLAHPVKPKSYVEMNNFYTATIYEKGSEVIRMMATLLGTAGFKKGMDLYFKRHDGQAVTTEDFVAAMEDANRQSLTQFKNWYHQAGTPHVWVKKRIQSPGEWILECRQSIEHPKHKLNALLLDIPILVGFIDSAGQLAHTEYEGVVAEEHLLRLTEETQSFRFSQVPEDVVFSLFRGFSAPVEVHHEYTTNENLHLLMHDTDYFNRWEAGQRLLRHTIQKILEESSVKSVIDQYAAALISIIENADLDAAVKAELLALPSLVDLIEYFPGVNFDELASALDKLKALLSSNMAISVYNTYAVLQTSETNANDYLSRANRALKNQLLRLFSSHDDKKNDQLIYRQFSSAKNMTNQEAALFALASARTNYREKALEAFYKQWENEPLVVDKWFNIQARAERDSVLEDVKRLLKHPKFSYKNPNKVRALIGGFCQGNLKYFHQKDGSGYDFLFEQLVILDGINPQVASRLIRAVASWPQLDIARQKMIQEKLKIFIEANPLSKNVKELAEDLALPL